MNNNSPRKFIEKISFLENVIEDIPVGVIVLDNDGRVVMMNRTQEMVSKVKRRKILGTMFHVSWKNIFDIRSGSNETFGNLYWELIKKKKSYVFVFHDVKPQFYEEKISGLSYGAPMSSGDGFILVHEISDEIKRDRIYLNKLNQQLSRSSAFLENLLDASPNAVITADEKGIIQTINKAAEKLFKIPYADFLQKPVIDLFDDRSAIEKQLKRDSIKEGIEITCRKSDGQPFQAKMQLSTFSSSDEASLSRLFLFRDITLEKALTL